MSKLLQMMNDRQKEAIQQIDGPLLVMAGAGSGKTRVLTHRIAYLLEEYHVNPWQILAITFTNKAAREMKERLQVLVGTQSLDMWIYTFHAMCVRILRREAEAIGYSRQFTIIDTAEQKTLIKRILKDKNLDDKKFNDKLLLAFISDAKNQMITPEMAKQQAADWISDIQAECYIAYQNHLESNSLFDFDDLIIKTVLLFRQQPHILHHYQKQFQYIHVDEYQDTNKAQYELVLQLSGYYKNICVVGDADQSIYGWRGADITNILNFEKDFPNAKTILLEQNYRSTQTILNGANTVIENNTNRIAKQLWTSNDIGDKISQYKAFSEIDEASFIAQQINRHHQTHRFCDMAILYRTNAQSRAIEDALMKHSIPYRIFGGLRFYDRAEIKDILAYLRLIANPDDDLSFERIINVPKRSIGKTSVDKMQSYANLHNMSLFQAVSQHVDDIKLTPKTQQNVQKFVALVNMWQTYLDTMTMTQLVDKVLHDIGYVDLLKAEGTLEAMTRIENIEEFKSVTTVFDAKYEAEDDLPAINQFLTDFALDDTVDNTKIDNDEVTLMTIHSAKGLEFPIVFIAGLEESIFPTIRSIAEEDVEEERRLMYVGMTRAKEKLYVTYASSRLLYGQTKRNQPSRFLNEIDFQHIERVGSINRYNTIIANDNSRQTWVKQQATVSMKNDNITWGVGNKVLHKKFGVGTIVRVSGEGTDCMLDVAFDAQGIKKLSASFAPIEKIDK